MNSLSRQTRYGVRVQGVYVCSVELTRMLHLSATDARLGGYFAVNWGRNMMQFNGTNCSNSICNFTCIVLQLTLFVRKISTLIVGFRHMRDFF